MKLATLKVEKPRTNSEAEDGRLVVVHSSGEIGALVPEGEYPNLLSALSDWQNAETRLRDISSQLEQEKWKAVVKLAGSELMACLPRCYSFLDGSAFIQHIILVRKARNAEPPDDLYTVPLMYQGMSDRFLAPKENIPLIDEDHGMDFEAEVAVVLDEVPMGTKADEAEKYIALLLILNDVSLRGLIPREMKTGFGFLHGKPNSALSPFAVTPDELGDSWRDGRLHLNLESELNGEFFGKPNAGEMHFSFFELIEHAAKTRTLAAGTILGSGTVANKDETVGSSCLAERRMLEIINTGAAKTPFMKIGDTIKIDMRKDGKSIFGVINQKIVSA